MKVCPNCESENEDQYLYCIGCQKRLPKQTRLAGLMNQAELSIKKREFRKAVNYLDQILKLNIGDKSAWLMKGIALSNLGAGAEARTCYISSGVKIRERSCVKCMGSGKCMSCGQSGICYMCKSRRRCPMCRGTGSCHQCNGIGCNMCKDTGTCIRCKGSGECVYCKGTGICPDCNQLGSCGFCGGTGKEIQILVDSVPFEMKKYLELKKH